MATGGDVLAGVGILGSWVEISVSGGGVRAWDVEGNMSLSLVVI